MLVGPISDLGTQATKAEAAGGPWASGLQTTLQPCAQSLGLPPSWTAALESPTPNHPLWALSRRGRRGLRPQLVEENMSGL